MQCTLALSERHIVCRQPNDITPDMIELKSAPLV